MAVSRIEYDSVEILTPFRMAQPERAEADFAWSIYRIDNDTMILKRVLKITWTERREEVTL